MVYNYWQIGFRVVFGQRFMLRNSHRCRTSSGESFRRRRQTRTAKNQGTSRPTDFTSKLSRHTYNFTGSTTYLPFSLFYESEDICHIKNLLLMCLGFIEKSVKERLLLPGAGAQVQPLHQDYPLEYNRIPEW